MADDTDYEKVADIMVRVLQADPVARSAWEATENLEPCLRYLCIIVALHQSRRRLERHVMELMAGGREGVRLDG